VDDDKEKDEDLHGTPCDDDDGGKSLALNHGRD